MKLINEKTKKIIYKIISVLLTLLIIDIPLVIFIFVSELLINNIYSDYMVENSQQSVAIPVILLLLLPVIIYIILRILLFIKNKTIKIIIHIIGLIFIPISVILYLYLFAGYLFAGLITSFPESITPPESEYNEAVKKVTEKEYRIKHFPSSLPNNAQNYYFYIDGGGMHGYAISHLQFNTDNEYLDNVIKQNKDNIYKKLPYEEVSKYYKDFGCIGKVSVNAADKYDVYILKNNNDDDWYTSGFIISKELNDIIYFYANYSLEINHKKKDNKQNLV